MGGKARLEPPGDRLRQKLKVGAPRSLSVDGIRQASLSHLFEHPPYPLAQLLPKTEIGADTGDARVSREAHGLERILEIHQAGKATRARDLDSVVEDLHPDVIAGHAVGTMDGSVDNSLEPSIVRHQWNILKGSTLAECPASGLEPLDLLPSLT